MDTPQTHQFKVIGTRPVRHDGLDKVIGRAKYGADYSFPGMLYGKVLRSPYAHARIKSINTEKALRLPGVKAVVTHADFAPQTTAPVYRMGGEAAVNPLYLASNILAKDKVLYAGHGVAAVAATSPHIAEEALALIEVEYEPLPLVLDLLEAMKPGAAIINPDLRRKDKPDEQTNIAGEFQFKRGDIEAGFKAADIIVEREFRTEMVHQGYIEPPNALGIFPGDGHATVYTSTQGPFDVRIMSATLLGLPEGNVKVVPAEIGGGFGAKLTVHIEPVALLLSKHAGGRPVKMVMTRTEMMRGATGPTSGSILRVKMGATKEGRIVAAKAWFAYEAGAFPGSPVWLGCFTGLSPYDIENFLVDGYDVLVNKPKTSSYRAPGATNAAFAVECVVDELANRCGMDPLDFRIRNASREGTQSVMGPKFPRIGYIEVCEAIKNSQHYRTPLAQVPGKYRGRGVATGFWINGGMQSSAIVNVHADGTASLVTGSVDIGGSRASTAMVVAEVLGLRAEDVRPAVADTDSIGYTDGTGGSRVAFATGLAAYQAAHDVVRQLKERAAKVWEISPEDVAWVDGKAISKKNGAPPLTLKELAPRLTRTGGPVTGRANVYATGVGPAFAACLVDVEIDPETAKVQVLRCTVAQDAGKAIHPSFVEGQMQGGTVQGLGWALNEEYVYDEKGTLRNASFLDYRMPTCLDLPMIEPVIVEVANPGHPLGVRGVGEVSIVPPPAAVANAVSMAVGSRITDLPISPPRLFKVLAARRG
jgi:xanthine dehydrogenase molybdenum-binding subunit